MTYIAYKYRIYPTRLQRDLFIKTFGCVRWCYNQILSDSITHYQQTKLHKLNNYSAYTVANPWLKEVDSCALNNAHRHVKEAYARFFKVGAGFPKFKSKNSKQSYTSNNNSNVIRMVGNKLKLPKVGLLKISYSRKHTGTIKSATISRTMAGYYYVSILCDTTVTQWPMGANKLGIDVGLKDLAVLPNGTRYKNPKFYKQSLTKIKKYQRILSRKASGSNNYNKIKLKLAKVHSHIANQRMDYLHKVSTDIIKRSHDICLEDLKIKSMLKNHKLAQAIADAGWYTLREMLQYKAAWHGRTVTIAASSYPSSKLCNCCGYKNKALKLSHRTWTCNICGRTHDRDINAAINLSNLIP